MVWVDLLYLLLLPLTLVSAGKYFFKRKYRRFLRERFFPKIDLQGEPGVWVHAVSVGEVRSLTGLLEWLSGHFPQPIILSVTTPAGYDYARSACPGVQVIPAPLDFSFIIRRFLNALRPRLMIFNELEIWPNWITGLERRHVPVAVVNGRISDRAFCRYRCLAFLSRHFLRSIALFVVQSELYRARFLALGVAAEKIRVCGNIKADEASQGAAGMMGTDEIRRWLKIEDVRRPLVVLASTHPRDEDLLLPALAALRDRYFFILVPRHVDRLDAIRKRARRLHLDFSVWSETDAVAGSSALLILDCMGYLFPVMKAAAVVFMGGTRQRRIGGHNLFEPAVLGKPVVGGRWYNNFPDIGRELEAAGAYIRVNNREEFIVALKKLTAADLGWRSEAARRIVAGKRGALTCTLAELQRLVEP